MADVRGVVLGAPEEDSNLAPVHINEAFGLVGHVGAHATPHDTVPSWQVHLIELSFDDLSDVVEDPSLLEGERNCIDSMLLHVLIHVGRLDNCVLSLLLVLPTMRLHHLRVGIGLPILGLGSTCVSCNIRYTHRHFSNYCFVINYNFFQRANRK